MRNFISVGAVVFLVGQPLHAQQFDTIETFGGAWDTSWGDVWVMPEGPGYEGTYEDDNGRFWLEFTDHVYDGYWAEDMADVRYSTPVMGSYYWGRLQLSNNSSYPGIQMLWGYCETGRVDKVWSFRERLPDGL